MGHGARAFYSAVLVEKEIGRPKPIQADFIGVVLPDRYVFGFGMDINGVWRNLPAIYACEGRGFVKNAQRIVVTLTASQFPGA